MWRCPAWASENGKGGAWKPRGSILNLSPEWQTLQGRVGAYQLYHEVNLQGMMNEADMNFIKENFH